MTKDDAVVHCQLHPDTNLVQLTIDDGDHQASIVMSPAEAREAFTRMFNIAASARDYAK